MDRRRTYVDVVERVLGNSLPADESPGPAGFLRDLTVGRSPRGSTISEIHVSILDSIDRVIH
jgi:hypothetical protein